MKPCPFCGGDKIDILAMSDQPGDLIAYGCQDCGALGPADLTEEGAQEKWETRSQSMPAPPLRRA
jgi:Lar family restriction alleviation protein